MCIISSRYLSKEVNIYTVSSVKNAGERTKVCGASVRKVDWHEKFDSKTDIWKAGGESVSMASDTSVIYEDCGELLSVIENGGAQRRRLIQSS